MLTPLERKELIEKRLTLAFAPTYINVVDESHQHVGHAGAKAGGSHFALTLKSAAFKDLPLIKRHQLIYEELKDLIPHEIHAIKINAST
jgi:BolA protein